LVASYGIPRQDSRPIGERGVGSAFLSISFETRPDIEVIRGLFRSVFAEHGIQMPDGIAAGVGLIKQLYDQIKGTDVVLLDLTSLRPNVILEMGMALALEKRLIPIRSSTSPTVDLTAYPFLLEMGILDFLPTADDIRRLRGEVLRRAHKPLSKTETLHESASASGVRLRQDQKPKTLGLYYPASRQTVWESLLPRILEIARARGHEILIVGSRPNKRTRSLFDNLVWATSKADRLIIDSTGSEGPDMYAAFALGFGFALSQRRSPAKQIIRIEEAGTTHRIALGMWPQESYHEWRRGEDIWNLISSILPGTKA